MGTTVKDIVVAARAKLATIPTTRDAAVLFKEHKTNQPFKHSPHSGADAFEIVARDERLTSGFGTTGDKEGEFKLVVRLGHAPFDTDDKREDYLQQDIARIIDLLEAYVFPVGTQLVLFDQSVIDKSIANWWMTELFFKVVYTGPIAIA